MQLALQKTTLLLLALVLVFASMSIARAEETSVEGNASAEANVNIQSPKPRPLQILNNIRANIKDKIQGEVRDFKMEVRTDLRSATSGAERKDIIKDAREQKQEFRSNMKERLQALFRTHLGSAIARLNAALRHFDNFVERIESRIEKLKERGIDTASVETSLASSVSIIATAKVDVQALSDLLSSVSDTTDVETVKAAIRAAIEKATASVKAAHRSLVEVAKALSALVRASVEINSETTVDANN